MSRAACGLCGRPFVWARTEANNKPIPLNPLPDPGGNQAAYRHGTGAWLTRQLKEGEEPYTHEKRYNTHFATCSKRQEQPAAVMPLPANVIPISAARKRRAARRSRVPRRGA